MKTTSIKKSSYGNYSSSNYGAHTQQITIGNLTLYFSYDTVIAFHTPSSGEVCCENCWGTTTGKHLNWIEPNHKHRETRENFEIQLATVLKLYKLIV